MTIVAASLSALQAGEQVTLAPNDILRVTFSFQYTVLEATTVIARACPYQYKTITPVLDRIGSCCGEEEITLARATTPTSKEVVIDLVMLPAAEHGIADGVYGLIAEMPGYGTDAQALIDDCIIISGNPEGMWEIMGVMMPMMMLMAMMGMIVPMIQPEQGGTQ